jgi:hypothetical protein
MHHSCDKRPLRVKLVLTEELTEQAVYERYLETYTLLKKKAGETLPCQGKLLLRCLRL